jgi:hypothetical protein
LLDAGGSAKLSFFAYIVAPEPIEDFERICGPELPQLVNSTAIPASATSERDLKIMREGIGIRETPLETMRCFHRQQRGMRQTEKAYPV